MNRSYSKIRHIQESNLMLENRILEEKSKHLLMETIQSMFLTLNIPTKNNYIDKTKNISFSIGPLGKNAANEYTGIITTMILNGEVVNKMTNQSLNGEYVTGEIMMNNASDQLVSAITNIVSNDLIDQNLMNKYSANFVKKPDPNNPSAPKQQNVFIQKVIKNQIPSQ